MPSPFQLRLATRLLRHGGIVAHPTEAVYGLACDPLNAEAVSRLLAIKNRPLAKGLILIAADFHQLRPFIHLPDSCNPPWLQAVLASWPGPYTWLLPAAEALPTWINGGHDKVATRVTAHPLAAELCRRFGGPLVSTSANRAGRTPARTAIQVQLRQKGVDMVLHGPTCGLERPTPIQDALTRRRIRL